MNTQMMTAKKIAGQELVIERIFDVPREQVWKAWTDPEHMKRWWGPESFTAPFIKIDFRVGGNYLFCMRSPEGRDYWSTGVYQEIAPLEKIVYTDSFADEHGEVVTAAYYGMTADYPRELYVTVTFEEQEGKTKQILTHLGFPSIEERDNARAGWSSSFDKLARSLK